MMLDQERGERAAVIAEALSWERTPYHHRGSIKGLGVDCAMFLVEVYCGTLGIARPQIEDYPPDWSLHRGEERFLHWVLQYGVEVNDPMPADIAMFKNGRCAGHGSIVVAWPTILHAFRDGGGVCLTHVLDYPRLRKRLQGFYRLRRWV